MLEILIGTISGIISGIGMGGGTVLIFLLTFMLGIEQHIAQGANLIFFIPTSIVAIIVNFKNKNIDLKLATIISIFGVLGAIVGANLAIYTNVKDLKKYFRNFFSNYCYSWNIFIIKEYINSKNKA